MPRKIRVEYPGAIYPVIGRGNQGQAIYDGDEDRTIWLETVGEACEKTGWWIHAYVIMNDHLHLLSERLSMGDESWVTQAIGRVKARGDRELRGLRARPEKAGEDQN